MFDVKNLNDEYFAKLDPQEILDIKTLSTEDKIKCFKFFLTNENIANKSVITNIFFLINGITTISNDVFNDNRLFFSSLDDFVDIKLDIKPELDNFKIKCIEYYLGIIEGLNIKLLELKVEIPHTYFHTLYLFDNTLISKLMISYLKNINLQNVKPVHNASELYTKINNPNSLMIGFLQDIIHEVNK